jgi:hypothetical protein
VTGTAIRDGDHRQAVEIDLARGTRQPITDRLGQAAKVAVLEIRQGFQRVLRIERNRGKSVGAA